MSSEGFSQTDFLLSSLLMNAKRVDADLCQQDATGRFYKETNYPHTRDSKAPLRCRLSTAEFSKSGFVS